MGWLLSDEEREALFADEPFVPKAWESPDERADRYEKALRGILACSGGGPAVWMLQAVAASALKEERLLAYYMGLIEEARNK